MDEIDFQSQKFIFVKVIYFKKNIEFMINLYLDNFTKHSDFVRPIDIVVTDKF